MTFLEMGLEPNILRAIGEMGFVNPTPVQAKTIPHLLESDQDIIALAQTGTGKTAAFGLPIVHLIHTELKAVQALVLCPTRELCIQIASDLDNFSKYVPGLNIISVYGGAAIGPQIKAIKHGAQIVVGTPGRTLDLINRGVLKVDIIQWVVFDEADEMLNMGFKEDLDEILKTTPEEKQTLLFSATMPAEISRIAKKYMQDALEISVGAKNAGADNVSHEYYMVQARDRYSALKRIADMNPKVYGIVFCRTRQETKDVADKLINDGYNADALHGDLSQPQRDMVMSKFRQGHLNLLVATDVAARGLDVNDLTHVINFNLPDDPEVYVHRTGRTGRAGKNGKAVSIIHTREKGKIKQIENLLKKEFEHKMVPGGRAICEKQLFNLVDTVENIGVDDKLIDKYLPEVYKKLEWLSREDLIKRFISVEFNRFLEYYKDAPDLNVGVKEERSTGRERGARTKQRGGSPKRGGKGMSRLFVNVGAIDKVNPAKLIGMINDFTQVRNIEIGEIDVKKKYTFFEVDRSFENQVIKSFNRQTHNGRKINVEPAEKRRG